MEIRCPSGVVKHLLGEGEERQQLEGGYISITIVAAAAVLNPDFKVVSV